MEIKFNEAPSLTPSMRIATSELALDHLWIVYPGSKTYPEAKNVTTRPLKNLEVIREQLLKEKREKEEIWVDGVQDAFSRAMSNPRSSSIKKSLMSLSPYCYPIAQGVIIIKFRDETLFCFMKFEKTALCFNSIDHLMPHAYSFYLPSSINHWYINRQAQRANGN